MTRRGRPRGGRGPVAAVGVLGSAFNPPHLGHLALAQEALWQLGLERVLLVPTGRAPHKRILDDPGAELRLTMTRLAATEDERFVASTLEVEREGPSYTHETLESLASEGDDDLVFIMGADAAVGLESWREPERVVELARLAIARRAGISASDVASVLRSLGAEARCEMLDMPEFGISSSAARERAKEGRPLRYVVPEPVARFIEEKGVYSR
ncbi:MAG: nicotinate-nucleotide adenylyltransferase [Solirubrobacterales bacterium]